MELTQYLTIARRWWWLLVVSAAIGGGVAFGLGSRTTPSYSAAATLFVQPQTAATAAAAPTTLTAAQITTSEQLATTFAELVTVRPVLEDAIELGNFDLSVRVLERRVTVIDIQGTSLLRVLATAPNPNEARDIANVVAQAFIDSDVAEFARGTATVKIVEPAIAPIGSLSERSTLNIVLGAMLAAMAAAALVLVLESLNTTIRGADDVSELTGLPTLGHLQRFNTGRSGDRRLEVVLRPNSGVSEEYRAIRTNLTAKLNLADETPLLVIASPARGDGKTTTAANLAVVFGLAGRRVALVDTDLREPSLHSVFQLDNSIGLTTLLTSDVAEADSVIQSSVRLNVSVLTSGPPTSNPSELLGSRRMQEVLDTLRQSFDVVLFDSPPALSVTDASVLAAMTDGTLLVIRPEQTRRRELLAALENLTQSGRPALGVILNQVRRGDMRNLYSRRGTYPVLQAVSSNDDLPAAGDPVAERRAESS